MRYEAGEKADAGNPDSGSMEEAVEKFGVVVKGIASSEDEEVSTEMAGKKEDEGKTSEGHNDFATDG